MNVLIVSPYPPDPAPEANHALHISEQMAGQGHTVHVLCKKGGIAPTHPGIVVHAVMEDWTWSALPKLKGCLQASRPDVVLLLYIGWVYDHHPMITFLPTICKAVLPGVPCVTQFEAVDCDPLNRTVVARAIRKTAACWAGREDVHWTFGTLLRDSARIISLSSPHRDSLVHHYPGAEEKTVILPPPPLIRFCRKPAPVARREARAAIGAEESDFVLVYWGYIYPGKGVETLLEAFRIVCGRMPNMRLVLVGGALDIPSKRTSCLNYFNMVRHLSETLGLAGKVTWTGTFSWDSDEGSLFLHGGDACVLPFDYGVTLNNSSLAAASTHGLPVISTEIPVGRDEALEHGRNIFLCRPKDPDMLADAIQLVTDAIDFRERLRHGIKELAQSWHNWDTMTLRLVNVLESAIARSKTPQSRSQHPAIDGSSPSPRPLNSSPAVSGTAPSTAPGESPTPNWVWRDQHAGYTDAAPGPLMSVIVAVYNVEKYLCQCLDSLVNQTLQNIEIVVVNDASTDNSPDIIKDYAARYPQIRSVNCDNNKGLATVRNVGLMHARGQYIAFTDGDDWVDARMCEVLYHRAHEDDLDVLIADAIVLYENSKVYGMHFDEHIRQSLDPRLRTRSFDVTSEPRALLVEPVAWTKIYKRSFLHRHAVSFEDGMNSYEDICFHFSVFMKAERISMTDETLSYYRQNRPGQISGRTSRKVFEVFAVFRKIRENLAAWDASADVWAMLIKVKLRQFDWLLKDRVQADHKKAFMALVAEAFGMIPESGFKAVVPYLTQDERLKLFCMRRNRFRTYNQVVRHRWPVYPLLDALLNRPTSGTLRWAFRLTAESLRRRAVLYCRTVATKLINLAPLESQVHAVETKLSHLIETHRSTAEGEESSVEACKIGKELLFFSYPAYRSALSDALWRMDNDYYLTRTATFRDGDIVMDIGAHVGVLSIYLARRYPFIQVYAVEPDPLNYAALKQNIERNGVTNITAINKALCRHAGKRTLYVDSRHSSWTTIDGTLTSQRLLRTAQVECCTLEQLFNEYDIDHCRVLKITALGATYEALEIFRRRNSIDLLCGEIDLRECSRARLEATSWRIARQHFWRTVSSGPSRTTQSWIQQLPHRLESQTTCAPFAEGKSSSRLSVS
jgi:FkbM family methyltransferase